jgi:tetratricopeptide (TPR) repeat protein
MRIRLYSGVVFTVVLAVCLFKSSTFAANNFNSAQQGDVLLQQGWQQLKSNDFQASLTSLQSARSMYSQVVPATSEQVRGLQGRQARTLALTAVAYRNLGNFTKAVDYAQRALSLGRQINDKLTINWASQVLAALERTNQPNVVSRPQTGLDNCAERCQQQYPDMADTGAFLDCLEACQGREGHYAEQESRYREMRENRDRSDKDAHNQKCQDEYNARIARGDDPMAAWQSYSHCVQY